MSGRGFHRSLDRDLHAVLPAMLMTFAGNSSLTEAAVETSRHLASRVNPLQVALLVEVEPMDETPGSVFIVHENENAELHRLI
jgi:hypothetical protein